MLSYSLKWLNAMLVIYSGEEGADFRKTFLCFLDISLHRTITLGKGASVLQTHSLRFFILFLLRTISVLFFQPAFPDYFIRHRFFFCFFFFKKPQRVHSSWTWGDAERTRAGFQNNNFITTPFRSSSNSFLFFSRKSQSIYYGRSTSFLPSFILYLLAIIRLPLFVKRDPRNACTQQVTRRVKSRGSGSLASAVLRVYFFSLSPFFSPIGRR